MPCMLSLQRIPGAACLSALLLGLAGPMSSDACFHHDLQGDKVKLTMQFKGREMEFQELGRQMFDVSSSPQQRNATALLIIQPFAILVNVKHSSLGPLSHKGLSLLCGTAAICRRPGGGGDSRAEPFYARIQHDCDCQSEQEGVIARSIERRRSALRMSDRLGVPRGSVTCIGSLNTGLIVHLSVSLSKKKSNATAGVVVTRL